jgi:hypothetical protein
MPRIRSITTILFLSLTAPALIWAAKASLLYGAQIYIAPSHDQQMSGFLTSAIEKRKLPVILSPTPLNANFILAAYARDTGMPLAVQGTHTPKPVWEAKIVLADAQTHAIVWSASYHGFCGECDASPVRANHLFAEKFAHRFEHEMFTGKSISDRIDDILAP